MCQQVYSASVIAALEVRTEDNDETRNAILKPVPHPDYTEDWVRCLLDTQANEKRNVNEGSGVRWLRNNRLGLLYHLPVMSIMKVMYLDYMQPMIPKLEKFKMNMK